MAPKRPYKPIIVYAGKNIKEYMDWGIRAIAQMVLRCPVCGRRLTGNGWRSRIARERSRGEEPQPRWIPVHQLVCPRCCGAGRHPWNFTVLPSFLFPFQHFVQSVRLKVFDLCWQRNEPLLRVAAATGVDRRLLWHWLRRGLGVMTGALPLLAAEILAFEGTLPQVARDACLWERWWALGLALRGALAEVDADLGTVPGSVLEWVSVFGARRQRWWAP